MRLIEGLIDKIKYRNAAPLELGDEYEFCPKCEANLTLQKGFSNQLPVWVCRGCGESLLSPSTPGNITWYCDSCNSLLNIQENFDEENSSWKCTKCGHTTALDKSRLFLTRAEMEQALDNPYRGLSDRDTLALMLYYEQGNLDNREDLFLVKHMDEDKLFVKKILSTYEEDLYFYLKDHPIDHIPRIHEVFKSQNNLIVIEDYIEGRTLKDILDEWLIEPPLAADIAKKLCAILIDLHGLDTPIIHRDIKPSNVIISDKGEVFLLDMNVAKWFKEDEVEDTRMLGTKYYAAPEQLGFGFTASSLKTDTYALGILLNVMVTGKLPKEEKAPEPIWSIIENCICLEPEKRYSDKELFDALDKLER